jgi:hypothetical protein
MINTVRRLPHQAAFISAKSLVCGYQVLAISMKEAGKGQARQATGRNTARNI